MDRFLAALQSWADLSSHIVTHHFSTIQYSLHLKAATKRHREIDGLRMRGREQEHGRGKKVFELEESRASTFLACLKTKPITITV